MGRFGNYPHLAGDEGGEGPGLVPSMNTLVRIDTADFGLIEIRNLDSEAAQASEHWQGRGKEQPVRTSAFVRTVHGCSLQARQLSWESRCLRIVCAVSSHVERETPLFVGARRVGTGSEGKAGGGGEERSIARKWMAEDEEWVVWLGILRPVLGRGWWEAEKGLRTEPLSHEEKRIAWAVSSHVGWRNALLCSLVSPGRSMGTFDGDV
eukprot:351104-Chlamydomonas_euryale.AAC.5